MPSLPAHALGLPRSGIREIMDLAPLRAALAGKLAHVNGRDAAAAQLDAAGFSYLFPEDLLEGLDRIARSGVPAAG